MKTVVAAAIAACCLLSIAGPARAEKPNELGAGASDRPWAKGVSEADQKLALDLFREGNNLLKASVFKPAADKYREALKHWDHPAIHYNLVLALLNLDQPIEVHDHLDAAMKFGPAPLDQEKFEQARSYKVLVEKQLSRISIKCDESGSGAGVVLDGQPLFSCPGTYAAFVRAGPHSITASKPNFVPFEMSKPFPAGELTEAEIHLFSQDDLTQYRRKWAAWVPWTAVGAGVLVAGSGALLHKTAANDFKSYDQGIQACGGCVPSKEVASKRTTGNTLQGIAIGTYVAGGAAVVTGAVLLYVNRLQPYRVDTSTEVSASPATSSLIVTPYAAPGEGGVTALARF